MMLKIDQTWLAKFYSNEIDFLDESVLGKIEIKPMEFEQNVNL